MNIEINIYTLYILYIFIYLYILYNLYFLWQVPELIEEYSQSLEDIMASQVPGGESGELGEKYEIAVS